MPTGCLLSSFGFRHSLWLPLLSPIVSFPANYRDQAVEVETSNVVYSLAAGPAEPKR
jgi:hypothetical protein